MTFSVLPAWLAWSLFVAAGALAAGAFIVRRRPPRVVVASMLLWQRVLDAPRSRSLWDRIRWIVSLVLAITIAVLVVAALARPERAGGAGGRVLIVLDSSWTMLARVPGGGSRWDQARAEAQSIVNGLGGREAAVATTAEGIVQRPTTDRALLEKVLADLEPTGADGGAWPRVAGASETHFVTDGAVARAEAGAAVVHSVFSAAPNVAVTAFELDETAGPTGEVEAFFAVANYADRAQPIDVVLTRGTAVVLSQTIVLQPFAVHRASTTVMLDGDPRFQLRVKAAANALDADDEAARWLWTARPLDVGVVGAPDTVPALLAVDRSLRVRSITAQQYPTSTADVWVFDRWLPEAPPARAALVVDPPATAWFGQRGAAEGAPRWRQLHRHPILDGVDGAFVQIGLARPVSRPALEPLAASATGTALVAIEDSPAARLVVLGFSTTESNVTSTPWFPVLLGNAIDWLGRPERGLRHPLGPIVLSRNTTRLVAPNGQPVPVTRLPDRVLADLRQPGLYLVESPGATQILTVALDDAGRSNLTTGTADSRPRAERAGMGTPWPWWTLAGAAALALVLVEWFTWQRRLTV